VNFIKKRRMYLNWLLVLLLTGCIYSALVYHLSSELNKKESVIKTNEIITLRTEVNSSIMLYERLTHYIFNDKLNVPGVLKIIDAARNADDTVQSQLREDLYDMLFNDYNKLTGYGIRHMQFHFPDGTSFLRMHQPEVYGDNLFDIRETIKQTNQEQKYVSGFEEGRIYNGYRFVYPLFYEHQHIGSGELSISMGSIQSMLNTSFPDNYHEFIIKKELVNNVFYEFGQSNYMPSLLSNDFLYDKDVYLTNTEYWEKSESELINKLIDQIKNRPDLIKNMQCMNDFSIETKTAGDNYLISFLAINDYSGNPAAYFVSYSVNEQLSALRSAYSLSMLLLTLLYIIFAAISFYYIKTRIKYEMQSHIDPLTCIYNRYKFLEIAGIEMDKYKRYNRPLSIILFDLDFFKKVNDNYGHAAGDYVLKTVAQIINKSKRSSDLFSRWGGEEFILLLPETPLQEALSVAERLRQALADYEFDKCKTVTASFGAAELESPEETLDKLIKKADQAL